MTATPDLLLDGNGLPVLPEDLSLTLARLAHQALDLALDAEADYRVAQTPQERRTAAIRRDCLGELHVELESLRDTYQPKEASS